MMETEQGLTDTYNRLKDPDCSDSRIVHLRQLHEQLDTAVLKAYGWSDIKIPPFCVATDEDKVALQAFEDEVIDRLFVLNEVRAKEEKTQAAKWAAPTKVKGGAKKGAKRKTKTAEGGGDDQGSLF
jgi:hypothetical protein